MKVETEPGQELSQESSHAADSSHEPTEDESSRLATISCDLIAEASFVDGSRYLGTWDALGMAGTGTYRMPHGVVYAGEIRDGMHHGQGSLEYPGNQVIDGVWNRGEVNKRRYTFSDGLVYQPDNWPYCRFPDRRFNRSKINGLNPAGISLKTEYQPTKVIPVGCYDSGDGIFDPSTLCVTNLERASKIIRIPNAEECRWIVEHCRRGRNDPVGYCPWLNENWSSEPPELPYRLAMSTDSPERWWRRIFTFERDTSARHDEAQSRPLDEWSTGVGDPECLCVPEKLSETRYNVCGDQSSEESSVPDAFREVVCEEMSSGDYEGEVEDLLTTVCCPLRGTYTITRRKATSTRSLESEEEVEASEESTIAEYPEEEEEKEVVEEEVEVEVEEEEEASRRESAREWGEAEEYREKFEFDDFLSYRSREKSMIGENESVRGLRKESGDELLQGSEVKSVEKIERKRSPGRRKRTKVVKQVGPKKQQKPMPPKRPCPPVIDAEQILQRKVGDLLFSPALEAPRSPVYLIRKECDKKTCAISKSSKYDSSKLRRKTCEDDRMAKKLSEKRNICLPSKLFVTINDL